MGGCGGEVKTWCGRKACQIAAKSEPDRIESRDVKREAGREEGREGRGQEGKGRSKINECIMCFLDFDPQPFRKQQML